MKLIAIDMDGTLLNSQGVVSDKNKKMLEKAVDAGILVVPASGRVLETLPKTVKQLKGLKYAVTSNGAAIYDIEEKKTLYQNLMSVEKVMSLLSLFLQYDIIVEAYAEGKGYFEEKILERMDELKIPKNFQILYKTVKEPIKNISQFVQSLEYGLEKINIPWLTEECKNKVWNDLKEVTGISITSSLKTNIEINNEGVNKGEAIKELCKLLTIDLSEVMAIGDSYNDKELLEIVGTPVVMENGESDLKKLGYYNTVSNDNDGVAEAIERFCF